MSESNLHKNEDWTSPENASYKQKDVKIIVKTLPIRNRRIK